MKAPMPTPLALQAMLAKVCDLADERGNTLSEVDEMDELIDAASKLLTREESEWVLDDMVQRLAQEFIDEKLASGEVIRDGDGFRWGSHDPAGDPGAT